MLLKDANSDEEDDVTFEISLKNAVNYIKTEVLVKKYHSEDLFQQRSILNLCKDM